MAHTGLSNSHQILAFCAQQDTHAQHLAEILRFLRAGLNTTQNASPQNEYAPLSPPAAADGMRGFVSDPSAVGSRRHAPMSVNTSLMTHPSYADPALGSDPGAGSSAGSHGYVSFFSPTDAHSADQASPTDRPQLAGLYDPQLAYYQWRYQSMVSRLPDDSVGDQGGQGMSR